MDKHSKYLAFVFHTDLVALILTFSDKTDAQDISGKALTGEIHSLTFGDATGGLGVVANWIAWRCTIQLILAGRLGQSRLRRNSSGHCEQ